MKPALTLCLAAGLTASGTLYGQAMIEYGIGIGRAGTAGAATGAGAAGIFSGLKGSLEQKPATAKPHQATAEEMERAKKAEKDSKSEEASEAKAGGEKTEKKSAASWDSGTLTTSSGFVISGLQRRPTRAAYGPSSSGPVVEVPAAQATPAASGDLTAPAPASGSSAPVHTVSAASGDVSNSGVFHPIVTQFGDGRVGASGPGVTPGSGQVATIDIPTGTPVDELVKRFGEPLMALTGISGEDYTEKYVFRTPDGARLTVLSIDGKVSTVIVESDPGARAAL